VAIVKSTLSGLKGVISSNITLKESVVVYDEDYISPDQIVQAIRDEAFGAELIDVRTAKHDTIPKSCWFFGLFC
jgi:copper chaperone CopZ